MTTFYGILIPFLGTTLGAACVFFLRRGARRPAAARLTGFAARCDGRGLRLEPAHPGH